MLQEVFTAAFNAILADEREINVRPWLYRIARNRSLNHLRRASAIGVDSMDIHFAEGGISTGEKVLRRESFRQLIADVQQLPETQRTALLLREIDALSYEQIAARDGDHRAVGQVAARARPHLPGRGRRGAQAELRGGPPGARRGGRGPEQARRARAPARARLRTLPRLQEAPQGQQPRARRDLPRRPAAAVQEAAAHQARLDRLGGQRARRRRSRGDRRSGASRRGAGAGAPEERAPPAASSPPEQARSPPRRSPDSPPPRSSPPAPSRPTTRHARRAITITPPPPAPTCRGEPRREPVVVRDRPSRSAPRAGSRVGHRAHPSTRRTSPRRQAAAKVTPATATPHQPHGGHARCVVPAGQTGRTAEADATGGDSRSRPRPPNFPPRRPNSRSRARPDDAAQNPTGGTPSPPPAETAPPVGTGDRTAEPTARRRTAGPADDVTPAVTAPESTTSRTTALAEEPQG